MALLWFVVLTVPLAACVDIFNGVGNANNKRQNVLLIMADDLRPELGCYSGDDAPSQVHPEMYTPNIDNLAAKSLVLKRAYAQYGMASPSRTSFMTARRPDTTHVYTGKEYFRDITANFTTLPEYFKNNGYLTAGLGKVFHMGAASGNDDPPSWTEPYYQAPNYKFWHYHKSPGEGALSWTAVPTNVHEKEPLPDQQLVAEALKRLEDLAQKNDPFFLAIGFYKPHLPFVFPAEFLKHYPAEKIQLPPNPYPPSRHASYCLV